MKNKIYAFIGPHASGKRTLISKLLSMDIHYIPCYTTRPAAPIDPEQTFYKTLSKEEFVKKSFIIKTAYKGNYYGILKSDILDSLEKYKISIVIVELNGLRQVAKLMKDKIDTIYIMTDYMTLVKRMLKKGEKNTAIKAHLEYAETNNEFDNWKHTDYVVKNINTPEAALRQIMAIMGLVKADLAPLDEKNE
jgi:guanylate kinase